LVEALDMWAALLAVLLVVLSSIPAAADEPDAAAIIPPRLSYLDGPVSFWRPGAEQWTPAQLNIPLAPGDQLHTGHQGTVELQVGGRAFVRAWGDSALGVIDQAGDSLHLKVADGHVVADLRAVEPGGILHIETPGAIFTLDRAGYYRVDVSPQATSLTTRRDGQARTTRIEAGATRTIAAPALDAWDRWNQARTDELIQAASARYVGDGVYGVRDLDEHGDWRVLPTYGAVWVPRGAPAGWAPYTTGRWVWDPRFGWTWVDTAVWGWAPFHHGRWVYLDGVCAWAPGPMVARPVYAPALVAFFQAPGVRLTVATPFVSWVALGWGEPVVPWWGRAGFSGRPAWLGWGGPRVVNNVVVTRTTIVQANDIRVYRNATVHRAVVAVAPERFGRARVEDARVTAIDARRLKPVRGPLSVAPDHADRTDPPAPAPRTPDVERARPADGGRPMPPARMPSTPRNDVTPRAQQTTSDVAPTAPRDSARQTAPRTQVRPRVEPSDAESPRRSIEPSRPEMPPRVDRSRTERRDTPDGVVPRRPEREDRRGPAASALRDSAPAAAPRTDSRPRLEPSDTESPRRSVEPSRPDMPPRVDRSPTLRRDTPDGVVPRRPEREDRRERDERRGPAASAPSVKGAAAHERQERGQGRERRDGRADEKHAPRATPSVAQ
jgi:hypothetical protein